MRLVVSPLNLTKQNPRFGIYSKATNPPSTTAQVHVIPATATNHRPTYQLEFLKERDIAR